MLCNAMPSRPKVAAERDTPILPVGGPEDDATQASADDTGANAASTTEAMQGDVSSATATPP